jgi:hypothetical protein
MIHVVWRWHVKNKFSIVYKAISSFFVLNILNKCIKIGKITIKNCHIEMIFINHSSIEYFVQFILQFKKALFVLSTTSNCPSASYTIIYIPRYAYVSYHYHTTPHHSHTEHPNPFNPSFHDPSYIQYMSLEI